MLMLIACGDSDSKNKSDSQKGYDYHDERNQDFYSRYMRKTGKDYFIAEPKKIREKLKLGEIPDSALARINLTRVERSEKRNFLVVFKILCHSPKLCKKQGMTPCKTLTLTKP